MAQLDSLVQHAIVVGATSLFTAATVSWLTGHSETRKIEAAAAAKKLEIEASTQAKILEKKEDYRRQDEIAENARRAAEEVANMSRRAAEELADRSRIAAEELAAASQKAAQDLAAKLAQNAAKVAVKVQAVAVKAEETAILLAKSNEVQVETAKVHNEKLDTIHTLVNSKMTESMQNELDSEKRTLVLLVKVIKLAKAAGDPPDVDDAAAVDSTKQKILELSARLADRKKVGGAPIGLFPQTTVEDKA